MSAIEAVSRSVKTMADGTLRLTVDISPIHAQSAFNLFGMPDVPLALARLTIQASTVSAQEETIAKERVSGLTLLAVQWCKDETFRQWLAEKFKYVYYISTGNDEKRAADFVKEWCKIASRKELSTDLLAAEIFNRDIRLPYMQRMAEER